MSISTNLDMGKLDLTPKKIAALSLTFIVAFVLTILGWSSACFGMFLIGIGLYMVPHMAGIKNVKFLTVYGIAFMVLTIIVGSVLLAPSIVSNNQEPTDNDYFHNVTCTYDDDTVYITATYSGEIPSEYDVVFCTYSVSGIGFTTDQIYGSDDKVTMMTVEYDSETNTSTISGNVTLDTSVLYMGALGMKNSNDNIENSTYTWFLTETYDGSLSVICLYGVFYSVVFIMIIFFMMLFMSAFMRGRLEKTRIKMESEGRLYPQGYGRCDSCGSVVLPGEVNCRKCGAYIDRPDEMKPKKVDFFTCSDCGAEVPADAKVCPKCGATFEDDVETEIVHPDGTVEVTNDIIKCPDCDTEVPSGTQFCPKCGKKI